MSTIKSSNEHLTLNSDGSSKDIKFQANGVEKASISSAGAFTSTTIDATKLTGNLPAINGSALTNLPNGSQLDHSGTKKIEATSAGIKITGSGIDDNVIIEVSGDDDNIAPDLILKRLSSSPADNDNLGGIEWVGNHDGGGENSYAQVVCRATDVSDGAEDGELRFYTATGGSMSEDMRLESDGDLHVDGDVIAYSTTISDATLKYDINPVEFALDKINQLKGVSYKYKHNNRESAGLLAQDVEKVMPSAVNTKKLPLATGDDKEYKTLHYDSMTAILVEAIKELTAKVKKLEGK